MSQSVTALVHKHLGQPGLVLGGAPSLPAEAERVLGLKRLVKVSANQHGCVLTKCDYAMVVDDVLHRLKKFPVKTVSPRPEADYRIFDQVLPSSGVMAAWLLWVMGCAPILVAGVGMYAGKTYFHDPEAGSTGHRLSVEQHMERWVKLQQLALGADFRALGGPLLGVYTEYREGEQAEYRGPPADVMRATVCGAWVRFTRDYPVSKAESYRAGARVELSRRVAQKCVRVGAALIEEAG